jgi:hypothetical protein
MDTDDNTDDNTNTDTVLIARHSRDATAPTRPGAAPTPVAAIPAKLPSGEWGARPSAPVAVGEPVRVTTRAGKTWTAIVTAVHGATVSTDRAPAAVQAAAPRSRPAPRPNQRRRTGCRCGSLEDYPRPSDCAGCKHDW